MLRCFHLLLDLVQDWNVVLSHNHTLELILREFCVPCMLFDILNLKSLFRVDLHDIFHQVFGRLFDISRHKVLAGQNFLIQLVSVCVFKW